MPRLRRSGRSNAAAALAWCAGFFLAFQIGSSFLLDYVCGDLRFSTAAYLFTSLRSRPETPDVVAFGSSRIGLAFTASEVGDTLRQRFPERNLHVMNFAVPSGDPITSDRLLARMLDQGVRPRIVVVEMSPEVVNAYNEWLGFDIARIVRWDDLPEHMVDFFRSGTVRRLLTYRLFPLCVYRQEIVRELLPWSGDVLASEMAMPSVPLTSDQSGLDSQGLWGRAIEAHRGFGGTKADTREGLMHLRRWLRRYRAGGSALGALERLLHRCREHDIDVVLVGIPFHSEHRGEYTCEIEADFTATMHRLTQQYGCRFVDYRHSLADDQFFDNAHVLPAGGSVFSRRLAQDILVPILSNRK